MLAIFLDVETSGLDPYQHRVLEIAFKILDLKTGEEKYTYHSIVKQPWEVWESGDPVSIKFNGFTWEKVQLGKEERVIGQEIENAFTQLNIERGRSVFICQNPAFDRGFFSQLVKVYVQEQHQWPYHWLDLASMYWALQVKELEHACSTFPDKINLSKDAIAKHYQLAAEPYPHCAINGVNHLIQCYKAVVGFPVPC